MLLFTGKGGVGKTSIAAGTAVLAARNGARVLVTSTDPAHSLADAFGTPLGDAPRRVPVSGAVGDGTLYGLQIDAQQRLEQHWGEVRNYLAALLSWGGVGAVATEELLLMPGLDELFALIDLHDQVLSGEYDVVIVDCAPTAETLKLLALPDALRWYTDRVAHPGRRLARALRPLARSLVPGSVLPVPDEEVFAALDRLHDRLTSVHGLLTDPRRTSVRLVANPERLVLTETRRTATTLSLFGYSVDAVMVNRMLPAEITDPFLARWRTRHAKHLQAAHASFAPTPVLSAPLLPDEIEGVGDLATLTAILYGERDPVAVLHEGRPITLDDRDGQTVLRLALPFVAGGDLDLHQVGDELFVKVSGVNRSVLLPAALRGHQVAGAAFAGTHLEVRFAPVVAEGVP